MKRLDLIIDALETSKPINQESSISFDKHLKALAAARSLRDMEPVAWMQNSSELYVHDRPTIYYTVPLYALGDEK